MGSFAYVLRVDVRVHLTLISQLSRVVGSADDEIVVTVAIEIDGDDGMTEISAHLKNEIEVGTFFLVRTTHLRASFCD